MHKLLVDKPASTNIEYVVESVIAGPNDNCEYRVRWRGLSEEHDTWEPGSHILTYSRLISLKEWKDFKEKVNCS